MAFKWFDFTDLNIMRIEEIPFAVSKSVYPPREDSWLLAQSIPKIGGKKCLDMGCGSGIQTAAMLLNGAERVTSVDKHEDALSAAKQNLSSHFDLNKVEFVISDLFQNIKGSYDFMVFNPPYVPTPEMKWSDTDGGKKGREVIDKFLDQFHLFLSPEGTCYLLQSSRNSLTLTQAKAREVGFSCNIVALQDVPGEELQVLRLQREVLAQEEEEPQTPSNYYS